MDRSLNRCPIVSDGGIGTYGHVPISLVAAVDRYWTWSVLKWTVLFNRRDSLTGCKCAQRAFVSAGDFLAISRHALQRVLPSRNTGARSALNIFLLAAWCRNTSVVA